MGTTLKRSAFTVFARNYKQTRHEVSVLPIDADLTSIRAQPSDESNFLQRWYVSLQGEAAPILSPMETSSDSGGNPRVYRYDWAFGITLIRGFWWDWMSDLADEDSLAVHLVLNPTGNLEAVPIAATLNALHPSRNTQSYWEQAWPLLPKAAADLAKVGAAAVPALDYLSSGLMATSTFVESRTAKQKNWFLYQFVDEHQNCPTVEWRIHRKVFNEYGPLIRGSLFLAFYGEPGSRPTLKMLVRPQVRYSRARDLDFLVPTDALSPDQQLALDIEPCSTIGRSSAD